MAGISLGIYHIGSFSSNMIFEHLITGVIFKSVYAVVENIVVIWSNFLAYWCYRRNYTRDNGI